MKYYRKLNNKTRSNKENVDSWDASVAREIPKQTVNCNPQG